MTENHPLLFVIQKHDATSLHYDFRLEIDGVMPSWSIPKGPTLDNSIKRLALPTTDHDMEYRNFEGVLPEGSYGAGPVMIWDEGYYVPEREVSRGERESVSEREEGEKVMKEGLKKGELKFFLHGKKLKGSFALVKTKFIPGKDSWLLIKHNDTHVQGGYNIDDHGLSVRTNRTIDEIAKEK